jgi:hypothetical protein
MRVSFDKWYPIVQPMSSTQQDAFNARVERLNAERALNVQLENQVKKFHQYEWEIYEMRMRQITLNIEIANNSRKRIDIEA